MKTDAVLRIPASAYLSQKTVANDKTYHLWHCILGQGVCDYDSSWKGLGLLG